MITRPEDGGPDGESPPTETLHDRRRPGRKNYANGFLIAMLRWPDKAGTVPDANAEKDTTPEYRNDDDEIDQLGASKGIILALAFGIVCWAAIGIAYWCWIYFS